MQTWKGLFTENEAKEIINCIESTNIKSGKHSNRDALKIAVNEMLGSHPLRDSIINKIESLTQEQVNEIINASSGILKETSYSSSDSRVKAQVEEQRDSLINSVFNPQED